jgi:FkbM family methyltransferase
MWSRPGDGANSPVIVLQSLPAFPHDIAFGAISRQRRPVRFVQIGAADGRRADPIFAFVKRHGWHGVLCEPLRDLFALLQDNYRGQDGLVFENVAITEKEELRSISRIPLERVGKDGIPNWAFGASSLVPARTQLSRNSAETSALNKALVQETVQCISLATLLERNSVDEFDVLQLDTEGYDANILRQLDFARYRPLIINMEWQWLTEKEQAEVTALLHRNNYSLYPSGGDLLATAVPVGQLDVPAVRPLADSVPLYFPGMIGLVTNIEVDIGTGRCARDPVLCEIFGSRGQRIPIRAEPGQLRFLELIDGKRTYREIAAEIGCTHDELLDLAQGLIARRVIEA